MPPIEVVRAAPFKGGAVSTRRHRGAYTVTAVLGLVLAGATLPTERVFAESSFALPPTVLGQTGTLTISSPDLLDPWKVRAAVGAAIATGSTGNRFDGLLVDAGAEATSRLVRGALALGLPYHLEIAVTVPYLRLDVNDVSTDGPGDVTVSGKLRLRDQKEWAPAAAASVSWITETSRQSALTSVTTNGYLGTLSVQLALIVPPDWQWTVVAEAGGFWRDPGRPESDSSLVYGLAGYVPIGVTGFYISTGELQWLVEYSGTGFRNDLTGQSNDAMSWASGLRYLREHMGISVAGVYTAYRAPGTDSSLGATVTWYVAF